MQAPFELTKGRLRLKNILDAFPADSPHWNEAQNRFQFVDRLLMECLGWEKPNIRVEHPDGIGGRADYVLGEPPKAVLEAKKESKLFQVPPTGKPTVVRKIQPLLQSSGTFKDAVYQVIQYCALVGAQTAMICNGPQLAIFQAMIPGATPLEGECYFFNGHHDYLHSFPLLWKLLSPEGITENRAYRDLSLHRNPRIPQKASEIIPEPYKFRYRNGFQENLRGLANLLLEEIEDNPRLKHSFYSDVTYPLQLTTATCY